MIFSLENKTAIITGGASGIGKAITQVFLQQGARVFVFDTDQPAIETLQSENAAFGNKLDCVSCDISNLENVKNEVARISEGERISILVNNAGVAHVGNIENTSPADLERLLSINIKGVFNCTSAVIPGMKKGGGVILNMASVAASTGIADRFAYSLTKGAVVSMTLSIAKDYIAENIRCNSISPARVHTPFVDGFLAKNYPGREQEMFETLSKSQPIGRMGRPEEIAYLALYLCSDEASFITGCDYPIDGGFTKLNT